MGRGEGGLDSCSSQTLDRRPKFLHTAAVFKGGGITPATAAPRSHRSEHKKTADDLS